RREAARLLGTTPGRWRHVSGVAARAYAASKILNPSEAPLLIAAAWLHDIGYSPEIARTGFHPLDGARHLRAIGASARLCALVAQHSAAAVDAEIRGLRVVLESEFPAERSLVAEAL